MANYKRYVRNYNANDYTQRLVLEVDDEGNVLRAVDQGGVGLFTDQQLEQLSPLYVFEDAKAADRTDENVLPLGEPTIGDVAQPQPAQPGGDK